MLRERQEQYLLQIFKIDKFGNYLVADPLNGDRLLHLDPLRHNMAERRIAKDTFALIQDMVLA